MEISVAPELLFSLGGFPVTNTTLITLLVSVFVIAGFLLIRKNLRLIPVGAQNIAEYTIESLLRLANSITQDSTLSKKFFPIIATIFIFVIFSNWIELLPGLGTIGINAVHDGTATLIPFIRAGSADLNMTIALSIITVFFIQFVGITTLGLRGYVKKFFISPFHKPYGIGTFTGLLELISEISRLISFSFRLFGNIFAGEVLLIVILNLVPYLAPVPFLLLEIFVGFIQAFVFAMLALVFLKMATVRVEH